MMVTTLVTTLVPLVLTSMLVATDAPSLARVPAVFSAPDRREPTMFAQVGRAIHVDAGLLQRLRSITTPTEGVLTLGDGDAVVVRLEAFRAVADAVEVRDGPRADPGLATAMRSVRHLRGTIVGETGSLVYVGVGATGAAGYVDRGPGRGRYVLRTTSGESRGLVHGIAQFDPAGGVSQPDVPLCAASDGEGVVAGAGAVPPGVRPVIDIAVDSDWEYFHIFEDAQAATEYVAALYGAIAAIYERDTDSTVRVVFLRLASDPIDLFNEPDPLGPFRDEWNANMQAVDRDVAQLLTGRRDLPYGGVAWLNATCGDFGYSVCGYLIGGFADPFASNPGNWDLIVTAHELGHNVGSQHTHTYRLDTCDQGSIQRGSIMSYCHINSGATANIDLRFHRVCADAIEDFVVGQACIASDCDDDGIPDADAIALGRAVDTNEDGIPDACQDCDGDGMLDPFAIGLGIVADVDDDGRPDACEPDCNGNAIPDSEDILVATSTDAYGDGVPDECEPDCNGNGIADYSDIQADMAIDLGRDGLIDACQDCDGDGLPDFAELLGSRSIWVGNANVAEVRELHPRSGVVVAIVPLGDEPAYDLVIGPDGSLYASAGSGLWRVDRVTHVATQFVTFPGSEKARGLAFDADGTLLVGISTGKVVKVDVSTGQVLGVFFVGAFGWSPRDVLVRANGNVLVSASDGHVLQFAPSGATTGPFIDLGRTPHDLLGVFELPDNDGILVVNRAQQSILRFDANTGGLVGRFDVQASGLLAAPWGLCASGDGRAVLAPSATSSSTVNGYNLETGYTERTYRVYGADAPTPTAIAVAPASMSDMNGNLVLDVCEAIPGDYDLDGDIDGADLAVLLGAWGSAVADITGDGTTNGADLAILLGGWS